MVLKLYMVPPSPPVRSVLLTAKALGLELENILVDLSKGAQLNADFLKINPQHTLPTLDDDGKIIWDSHAINSYLVTKYGKDDSLYPEDPHKRAIVNQRLHFNSGSIFSPALRFLMPLVRNEITTIPEAIIEEIKISYGFLEKFLDGTDWVAGDNVTIADLALIPSVTSISALIPFDESEFPNITAWIKRAESLPYFSVDEKPLEAFKKTFLGKLKSR